MPIPKNVPAVADKIFGNGRSHFADDEGRLLETATGSTADAFLADDPMAVNVMAYGLHDAMVMMMVIDTHNRRRFRLRADADEGSQSNGGSKNQIFHFEPLAFGGICCAIAHNVHAPVQINDT
ncbi:hypothetical protein QA646_05945 [Rhizobium sp. CB3090]|uniref:hypothetical protein n=1 Tax=Rhizobium sp. CB3090 TaxID=3039156 RepID=UPI0024B05004|nr:hypothetical protein [Rhizobium sp. CB3090]WFU10397.1 hypothetical protein QA646_05945 [Rhizobium sp. CB3090]